MLTAKTISKNKFWVVEKDGKQVATIQSSPNGVAYVANEERERFPSIKMLKEKHSIIFSNEKVKKPISNIFEVNGFICDHKPYNALIDAPRKLPIYTKAAKSKSYYCAGYYLVKVNKEFILEFCPKLIMLNRNQYHGPFHTKEEAKAYLG